MAAPITKELVTYETTEQFEHRWRNFETDLGDIRDHANATRLMGTTFANERIAKRREERERQQEREGEKGQARERHGR